MSVAGDASAVDEGAFTAPEPPGQPRLARVPALDGLRGLAVLAVLLFHGGYLTGGWLGVDLFFVLSGYLITSLLLVEHRSDGRIHLGAFWGRRARRLLPAVIVVLVVSSIYAYLEVAPIDLANVRSDGLATLFFVANWHDILHGASYWDRGLGPSLFAHTWSLAVEEQLYLVWPVVLTLVLRGRTKRQAATVARVALIVAGLSVAIALALRANGASIERIYLGTDTRAVAVALGAFVAGWRRTRRRSDGAARQLEVLAIGAGVLLLVAWWGLDGTASFTYWGGLVGASCLAAIVVAAAADPRSTRLGAALSLRPLRAVGLISYGLYLWHWPVYVALSEQRTGLDGVPLLAVRLVVTFLVAIASWLLVERPIRAKRPPGWWEGRRGLSFAIAGMAVAAIALLASTLNAVELPTTGLGDGVERPSVPLDGAPTVVVLGDSVAASVAEPALDDPKAYGLNVVRSSVLGCQVAWDGVHRTRGIEGDVSLPPPCPPGIEPLVASERPDAVVVFFGGWTNHDMKIGERWYGACTAPYERLFRARFAEVLREASISGAPVYVVNAPRSTNTVRLEETDPNTDCTNALMEDMASSAEGVEVVDLDGWLCPKGRCKESVRGLPIRSDGVHFQGRGGAYVSQWLLGEVADRAGLDRAAIDGPVEESASFRATEQVCRTFNQLANIQQGDVQQLISSQAERDRFSASIEAIDGDTLAALDPEVSKDLGPLADPTFQTWVADGLDRLAAGETPSIAELPPETLQGLAGAMTRLERIC